MPLFLLLADAALAAPAPARFAGWTGIWRLDRAASRFRGEVTRIARVPGGYRFDFGAVAFTLPDDGAFHATTPGRETRLARLGPGRWLREHRVNGRVADRSMLTLADSGRALLIAGKRGDVPAERLVREGEGNGLAGTWRSTRLGINAAEVLVIAPAGAGRLRWGGPADANWYVVAVNGPPAPNRGPTASPIATLRMRVAPDGGLRWTESGRGRPWRLGTDRQSRDGATIAETIWPATDPEERQLLVYRCAS